MLEKAINKLFTFKGNRQFSEAEENLISELNGLDNFIADEAFINYTHTELLAIDKEEKQFLSVMQNGEEYLHKQINFSDVSSYKVNILDRNNEDWLTDYSKWKKDKKFIKSISIDLILNDGNEVQYYFLQSENNDGDKVSSIPVKRAMFSMEKWDVVLSEII